MTGAFIPKNHSAIDQNGKLRKVLYIEVSTYFTMPGHVFIDQYYGRNFAVGERVNAEYVESIEGFETLADDNGELFDRIFPRK
jgi:hypothetical protein